MAANRDPQRRPVLYDLKNGRFLADPAIGSRYYPIPNTSLSGDATIDLINTATSSVIAAARVVTGSTSGAGVVELLDAVNSTSVTQAATPNAVKQAYDLAASASSDASTALTDAASASSTANSALPLSGGTMTGAIVFAAGQTINGYAPSASPELTGAPYVNGSYRGNVVAVGALDIDCSTGNYFTKTISSNSTFTFSNAPSSRVYSFTLEITHTSGTITWPSSVKWPEDTAPTLTTGKTHIFIFVTDDGGSRWRGAALVDYAN